jgi:hypothetical protein
MLGKGKYEEDQNGFQALGYRWWTHNTAQLRSGSDRDAIGPEGFHRRLRGEGAGIAVGATGGSPALRNLLAGAVQFPWRWHCSLALSAPRPQPAHLRHSR